MLLRQAQMTRMRSAMVGNCVSSRALHALASGSTRGTAVAVSCTPLSRAGGVSSMLSAAPRLSSSHFLVRRVSSSPALSSPSPFRSSEDPSEFDPSAALGDSCPNPHYVTFCRDYVHQEPEAPYRVIAIMLIGVHVIIYALWNVAEVRREKGLPPNRLSRLFAKMQRNFTCSLRNVREGRVYTMLTSAVSHESITHLAMNSLVLFQVLPLVASYIGLRRLGVLYVGAAISGSAFHMFYSNYLKPHVLHAKPATSWITAPDGTSMQVRTYDAPALGASGALTGLFAVVACVAPNIRFGILFIPVEFKIKFLFPAVVAFDVVASLVWSDGTGIAHWGHIGGVVFGALFYLTALRGRLGGKTIPRMDANLFYRHMLRQQRALTEMQEAVRPRGGGVTTPWQPSGGGGDGGVPSIKPSAPKLAFKPSDRYRKWTKPKEYSTLASALHRR